MRRSIIGLSAAALVCFSAALAPANAQDAAIEENLMMGEGDAQYMPDAMGPAEAAEVEGAAEGDEAQQNVPAPRVKDLQQGVRQAAANSNTGMARSVRMRATSPRSRNSSPSLWQPRPIVGADRG